MDPEELERISELERVNPVPQQLSPEVVAFDWVNVPRTYTLTQSAARASRRPQPQVNSSEGYRERNAQPYESNESVRQQDSYPSFRAGMKKVLDRLPK